jgi:aspartyl/glutamyl-tRNA(Asn/Gln) amidotransferase C subunit
MVTLTNEDITHIAKLVKLDIKGQEETLRSMLAETLDYIKVLDELKTFNLQETYEVNGLTNVFQKNDIGSNTFTQEEALKNAHEQADNLFVTKGVFDR